jgi:hypothetical protein
MTEIRKEIEAFKAMQAKLEAEHMAEWVLIHHRQLIGVYPSFDSAADVAIERFGAGPFLIRQVGATPSVLPASLAYSRPQPRA